MTDTSGTTEATADGDHRTPREGGAPEAGGARGAAPADLASDIGRRLAAHRGQRGKRVAELAREVGVTPSLISQIERGQSRPSVSTLFAMAQALQVPVDAFFREPAADGPAAAEADPQRPPAEQERQQAEQERQQAEGRYVVRR